MPYSRGRLIFPVKGQIVNILYFVCCTVFVPMTQLCRGSKKAAIDNL